MAPYMPHPNRPPSYRFHKARDCAVVTLHGKNHYLGPYGSPESHERYARLIAEWRADGGQPTTPMAPTANGDVTVNEVILRYLDFAAGYYVKHGKPTGELTNICCALRKVKALYGRSPVGQFSARSLELVREAMIADGWKRTHINNQVSRVKRMFRWGSKRELVPPSKGYDAEAVRRTAKRRRYVAHIARKGVQRPSRKHRHGQARRWVVERTHSWTNRARRLLVRWEKKVANYPSFLHLQFAIVAWRTAGVLG
jgi:Transposase DDE domain